MKTFGECLRGIRERKGLSVRQLAYAAGVEPGYVSKLENDLANASNDKLEALAVALNVNPHILMLMAGRLSDEVVAVARKHPEALMALMDSIPKSSEKTLLKAASAVRDGKW